MDISAELALRSASPVNENERLECFIQLLKTLDGKKVHRTYTELTNSFLCLSCPDVSASSGISLIRDTPEGSRVDTIAVNGRASILSLPSFPFKGSIYELVREGPLLYSRPERIFEHLAWMDSPIHEMLLLPIAVGDQLKGVIWIAAHTPHQFTPEDARMGTILAHFATTATVFLSVNNQLEHKEAAFRKEEYLLSKLPLGIVIFDKEFRFDFMNGEAERLYKIPKSEVMGRNVWEVFPQLVGKEVYEAYTRTMTGRKVTSLEVYVEQWNNWFYVVAHPLEDSGIVVFFLNIDHKKKIERKLADLRSASDKQKRIYETILSNTPDFAYVWSLDRKFIYANRALAELYGTTPEAVVGKGFNDLGYPEWHARMHEKEIDEVVATARPLRGSIPFTGANGGGIYDYIFVPVFGQDGQVEAVAGTTRDITEMRKATELYHESDQRKNHFLSVLAHELRNPMATIMNGISILKEDGLRDEHGRITQMMERQMHQLNHLVEDLMDVSRINRGAIELRSEPVELEDILHRSYEAVFTEDHRGRHEISKDIQGPLPVKGDPTRLEQIFVNLLHNACKYTPDGCSIWLSAYKEQGSVMVKVADNGIGIADDDLPTIFEMFSRIKRENSPQEGLGIGLNLVQQLVEMHGGSVKAISEGHGKGSEFVVKLPLSVENPQENGIEKTPMTVIQLHKVMVVDDNKDAADSLASLLKVFGHLTIVAYSGEMALELALEHKPDLIFLDIGMPRMDGHETCRRLRAMDGVGAKIFALTGWGQQEERERSQHSGFDKHLVKPLDVRQLKEVLQELRPRNETLEQLE